MLRHSLLWLVADHAPWAFSGVALHRAALQASSAGAFARADRLFDRAAARYVSDLDCQSLVRLRVHRLISRVRADGADRRRAQCLEIEHRLGRLEAIESVGPPFELIEAQALLGSWRREISRAGPPDSTAGLASAA